MRSSGRATEKEGSGKTDAGRTTTVITAANNSSGNTNIQCLERSVSETQSNRLTVHDLSASYPCLGPLSDWTALPRDTCGERPAFYIHARAAT